MKNLNLWIQYNKPQLYGLLELLMNSNGKNIKENILLINFLSNHVL